jgi:hypothetical protein
MLDVLAPASLTSTSLLSWVLTGTSKVYPRFPLGPGIVLNFQGDRSSASQNIPSMPVQWLAAGYILPAITGAD